MSTAENPPSEVVAQMVADPHLPSGAGERFALYGVMGLPFASGHYLTLRDTPAASIGPAFRSIWHRDPGGRWTIFSTISPDLSCPRYWGAGSCSEVVPSIEVAWTGPWSLRVRMNGRLDWQFELGRSFATLLLSRIGRALPGAAWRSDALLAAMGPLAGSMLGAGKFRLQGGAANGQHFRAAPVQIWPITESRAVLDGVDFGSTGPVAQQARRGGLWLPQRGFFFAGAVQFEALDSARHVVTTAGLEPAG
ncbi:MAG: hypothetical protein J2P16_09650 [Mycobacterium sp.]|nr:hypothetical protein [Mycobacterium sp.]